MKKVLLFCILFFGIVLLFNQSNFLPTQQTATGAPPYDASNSDYVSDNETRSLIDEWKRPDGPPKVVLQVGHWKNEEVPDELHKLRGNTGASGGGKTEWEVNYDIATRTKALLEPRGITVELVPATVPPHTWADAFVAIHADGNLDPDKSGYKASTPRRDLTGDADELLSAVETAYEQATGLKKDPNVTRNMRGYYAFSWWRYKHAVHPLTPSIILETGFLSSPADRKLLVDNPQPSAEGLAEGLINYLEMKKII